MNLITLNINSVSLSHIDEGNKRGALGFSVFRFWPFSRSVFRFLQWKTSVFRFCCPLWFPVFPFFSIWFSVFWQKQRGFSDFGDRCGFRFFQFGRTSKTSTNLHGLPMWFLWLCRIINCLQVTILLLQAWVFLIWSKVPKIVFSRGWFSTLDSSLPSISLKIFYQSLFNFCFCFIKSKLTSDNSLCTHAFFFYFFFLKSLF